MKAKKWLSALLAAAMCVTLLAGCGGGGDTKKEEGGDGGDGGSSASGGAQELVAADTADVTTMDPIQTSMLTDQRAAAPVYEGLMRRSMDENGELILVPGAAESYEVSDDELVYTFHLQPEGKFSNGDPVTAEDVVYSYKRMFDPNLASPQSWQLEDMILNARDCFEGNKDLSELGVKAIDDMTVEITLATPNPNFLTVSTFPFARIVSKKFVEECGDKFGSSADMVMGSGPFKVVSWEPGFGSVYEPNEYYWDKENVHITKLTRKVVAEVSSLAQSLMNKEIDIAIMNDTDWNDMVDQTGYYDVKETPEMSTYFFIFNCENPMFANWKIRLAISLAFDRDRFVEEAYGNKYIPAYSFEPQIATVGDSLWVDVAGDSKDYLKTLAEKYPDPKALLLEGMQEANLGNDPSAIEIKYTTLGTTEAVKKAAEWTKQELETNLGIKINIELTEANVAYDQIDASQYEMAFGGWGVDSGTEPWRLLRLFGKEEYYGEAKVHWTGEKADRYTELVTEMQQIFDPDRLLELYKEAEPLVLEEAPVTPVYCSKQRALVAKNVSGYHAHPFLMPDYIGVEKTAE